MVLAGAGRGRSGCKTMREGGGGGLGYEGGRIGRFGTVVWAGPEVPPICFLKKARCKVSEDTVQ